MYTKVKVFHQNFSFTDNLFMSMSPSQHICIILSSTYHLYCRAVILAIYILFLRGRVIDVSSYSDHMMEHILFNMYSSVTKKLYIWTLAL